MEYRAQNLCVDAGEIMILPYFAKKQKYKIEANDPLIHKTLNTTFDSYPPAVHNFIRIPSSKNDGNAELDRIAQEFMHRVEQHNTRYTSPIDLLYKYLKLYPNWEKILIDYDTEHNTCFAEDPSSYAAIYSRMFTLYRMYESYLDYSAAEYTPGYLARTFEEYLRAYDISIPSGSMPRTDQEIANTESNTSQAPLKSCLKQQKYAANALRIARSPYPQVKDTRSEAYYEKADEILKRKFYAANAKLIKKQERNQCKK